jgi:hypothetical protein
LNDAIPQWWVRKYSNPIPQAMSHKPLGSTPVTASSSGGGSLTTNSVQTIHIQDEAVNSDKLSNNIAIDGTLDVAGDSTLGAGLNDLTAVSGNLYVAGNTTLKGPVTFDMDLVNNNDTPVVVFEGDETTESATGVTSGSIFTMRPFASTATELMIGGATLGFRTIRNYATLTVDTSINNVIKLRVEATKIKAWANVEALSDLSVGGNTTLGTDTDNTITFNGLPKLPIYATLNDLPTSPPIGSMCMVGPYAGLYSIRVYGLGATESDGSRRWRSLQFS